MTRLTNRQESTLRAMIVAGPQTSYGPAIVRVHNNLVAKRLAYFVEISGLSYCAVTNEGREALAIKTEKKR